MHFPISGVRVFPLVPFGAALGISALTSMGGVSGAFLLLPFQVSVLGFISPAVTPTNHLFNVVAIPSGVYRYVRERRMVWPLAWVILVCTVPGVVGGSFVRLYLLPDPRSFKLFMGLVLLLIGTRLLLKVLRPRSASPPTPEPLQVSIRRFDLARIEYGFAGQTHGISSPGLGLICALVGVVGGAYGVGGGAFVSPLLVSFFDLPVHTIAGATLAGTCATSLVGVLFFVLARPLLGVRGVSPDWMLGGLLGLGGVVGIYLGARLQRFVPARVIEAALALLVSGLAASYVVKYFL
jgi:uncharacterized membrane protein YfcA